MKKFLLFLAIVISVSICLFTSCEKDLPEDGNGGNTSDTTHTHRAGQGVIENKVDSTCSFFGSFEDVVYCLDCNMEMSRDVKVIPKKEHTPEDSVIENQVDPTCEEQGSREIVVYCNVCEVQLSRANEIIDPTGHTPSEITEENRFAPTCVEVGGYDNVTYCIVCDKELSREFIEIPPLGHSVSGYVRENTVLPTCTMDGGYEAVYNCNTCGEEISRNWETVYATGHVWNDGGDRCIVCNQSAYVEESLEYSLSDDGTYYIVTGIGTWRNSTLVIPSTYEGLPVREIGNYAFQNCTFLEKVTIPASITRLGYGAALGCTGITKITLADRNGWFLMVGHDATSGTSIPALLLVNTSSWLSYVTDSDQYWLKKG